MNFELRITSYVFDATQFDASGNWEFDCVANWFLTEFDPKGIQRIIKSFVNCPSAQRSFVLRSSTSEEVLLQTKEKISTLSKNNQILVSWRLNILVSFQNIDRFADGT